MRKGTFFLALAFAGIALAACNNNKSNTRADSSATDSSIVDSVGTNTLNKDTSAVDQADSTHSFRNDRGTDSVSAGKSVPAKP